ncbi:MAG TPA: tetratricopeptide repeat protein [Thermoanaerobaculia bacterium]|nr:tetratricopeptide repeat protein [Thermoanaerobaculia bacterium]
MNRWRFSTPTLLAIAPAVMFVLHISAGISPNNPPGTRVYFVPSSTAGDNVAGVYSLLQEYLLARSYQVQRLPAGSDIDEAFRNTRGFAVVIGESRDHITATIYSSVGRSPRLLRASAPDAERTLADAILRHISETSLYASTDTVDTYTTAAASNAVTAPTSTEPPLDDIRTLAAQRLHERNYVEALQLFRRIEATKPKDSEILFNVALCLDGLKRRAEAQQLLEQIYRNDPSYEDAAITLAGFYIYQDRFAEAIAMLSRWLDSARNGPWARYNLGIAYLRAEDLHVARQHMAKIPADDRHYEAATRVIVGLDRRLAAPSNQPLRTPPHRNLKLTVDSLLRYWVPITFIVPLAILLILRHRVRPSITVDLVSSENCNSILIRNTSAGDVAIFDLTVRAYTAGPTGDRELGSVTSDLAASDEHNMKIQLDFQGKPVQVALAGIYYIFPKVRLGAFRFRRDLSLWPPTAATV